MRRIERKGGGQGRMRETEVGEKKEERKEQRKKKRSEKEIMQIWR